MKHINSRNKKILDLCSNKEVLDIGSTGQTDSYDLWPKIKKVAKTLQGIDTEKREDSNIAYGNMETYNFEKKFDIIVAGDVIEHVHNQGLFLENISRHLKDDGRLIISTPNAKWLTVIFKPNPTHVIWHDRYTLEYILKEYNFLVEKAYYYLGNKDKYSIFIKPLAWRQGMLFIVKKKKN